MQKKHEQSLTLYTQKTMGISYLRVQHGAKRFERRGPRWDTQSNQNYSSHGWALYNLLSCLDTRCCGCARFGQQDQLRQLLGLMTSLFYFFPPFLLFLSANCTQGWKSPTVNPTGLQREEECYNHPNLPVMKNETSLLCVQGKAWLILHRHGFPRRLITSVIIRYFI